MRQLIIYLSFFIFSTYLFAQDLSLEEIKTNLLNNPPNTGDQILREESILALDNILKDDSSRTSIHVRNFYRDMINNVQNEYQDPNSSTVIWIMYNHGFIVKTPKMTFAFDLVPGYKGWPSDILPAELLEKIKILFISHTHGDHHNSEVISKIEESGGYVFTPPKIAPGESLSLLGLRIKAHDGLHGGTPIRIFEILTPSGLKILHTGDNQTSTTLPIVQNLDILLLNGWVNESGRESAVVGMRNSIWKLTPSIMIPGHIQELGHDYAVNRARYEWAFQVDDIPLPTDVFVMAWGEQFICSDRYDKIYPYKVKLNSSFIHTNSDTLIITSEIINPANHNSSIKAILESFDKSIRETIQLYDDGLNYDKSAGDGLFTGKWTAPALEISYNIHINTVSIDSGYNDVYANMAKFTTIGPVVIESDTINSPDDEANSGDFLKYRFKLQNLGSQATATNITSRITSLDTCDSCASLAFIETSYYGDIAPGEIVLGSKSQKIRFSDDCTDDYQAQFALEIYSNYYHFWTDTFIIDVISGIKNDEQSIVREFTLYQNQPNPFNPTTIIKFTLPKPEMVKLKVFNNLGQKIETLLNQHMKAGHHEVEFNGQNLSSGIYFYRIVVESYGEVGDPARRTGEFQDVKKMILLR